MMQLHFRWVPVLWNVTFVIFRSFQRCRMALSVCCSVRHRNIGYGMLQQKKEQEVFISSAANVHSLTPPLM